MRKLFFVCIFIFLYACSSIPPRPSLPSEPITFKPSATPTLVPSPTLTPASPTLSPTPTPDPNFFRDEFDESLDAQWSWVREDPLNWSLTAVPGSLQITVAGGYVAAQTNPNLLLRPAPAGNFQIQTQITFRPAHNFQFAGLIVYQDESNFIQAGRGYCGAVGCIGEGLYMDYYKKGVVLKPDLGQRYRDINAILLRLSRRENTYTFEVSTNGKVWFIIGSHTSDMDPRQVGLVTGQRLRGTNLPAVFDYFEVRSLP
jgi:beta-xylosidase